MKQAKSTKRALLSAVLALVMTVSMLVGTTFAWFTDSVTSTNNLIVAGNLDVELYYQNDEVTAWEKVDSDTNVFKENTRWEPGHVEVIKLKVANEGSLALKYQLGVNIANEIGSINAAGTAFKLSDYIWYGITESDVTDRASALAAVSASAKQIKDGTTLAGELAAAPAGGVSEKVVTLVVYMPDTVGNDANYGKDQVVPEINLGIDLVATQLGAESDSFGDDYDDSALVPGISYGTVAGADAKISKGDLTVTIPAAAGNGDYTMKIENVNTATNANDETVVSFDLSLAKDGAAVVEQAGVEYAVEYFVGTDLQIIKLLHKGVEITNYNYDPATGYITFTTSSFSPFEIVYIEVPAGAHKVVAGGKTKYFLDIKEAIAAASGEAEITLGSDIVLEETLVFDKDATISLDMNGFGISGELDTLVKISDGTLSIKNGSFTNIHNTANLTYYNIYMCGDAKAEIKDVTINTSGIGIMMAEDSKITEMNANIGSFMKYNGDNCFSAIYLVDSASIDLISGGKYVSYYSDEVIESRKAGSISVIGSHSLRLDSEKAHVGKITGGEFLSVDDVGGMGAPIYISAGTIDLISGGHFGFVEEGASFNTFCSIYLNTSAGSIGAITGGTFVVGKYGLNSSGFRWDFASLVDASGCNVVDTGKTSHVTVQFTGSNLQSYDLKIIQVVAK